MFILEQLFIIRGLLALSSVGLLQLVDASRVVRLLITDLDMVC